MYLLTLDLEFDALCCGHHTHGFARTGGLTTREVVLLTENAPSPGAYITIRIDWPAALDGQIPLCLQLRGVIVRAEPHWAIAEFAHYEFRTRKEATRGEVHDLPG
jgi:hypothetical protein